MPQATEEPSPHKWPPHPQKREKVNKPHGGPRQPIFSGPRPPGILVGKIRRQEAMGEQMPGWKMGGQKKKTFGGQFFAPAPHRFPPPKWPKPPPRPAQKDPGRKGPRAILADQSLSGGPRAPPNPPFRPPHGQTPMKETKQPATTPKFMLEMKLGPCRPRPPSKFGGPGGQGRFPLENQKARKRRNEKRTQQIEGRIGAPHKAPHPKSPPSPRGNEWPPKPQWAAGICPNLPDPPVPQWPRRPSLQTARCRPRANWPAP